MPMTSNFGLYSNGSFLSANVPDGTVAGGNTRGTNAVDLQTTRTNASNVASGLTSTIVGGGDNRATGSYSTAGGNGSLASGIYSVSFGYGSTASGYSSLALGQSNVADASNSTAMGYQSATHALYGCSVYASGRNTATGDAQAGLYVLRGKSTAGSAVRMTADGNTAGTTNVCNVPVNTTWVATILVVARSATDSSWASWAYPNAVINRNSAAPFLSLGTPVFQTGGTTVTTSGALSLTVDAGAPNGLNSTFTPPNTNAWNIVAIIRTAEVQ